MRDGEPFLLGVNYWPRRKAMYWWSDFDADEVREDFDLIRDLGLHVVRIFLLWDDFQPTADSVSSTAMRDLTQVADIAAERGLRLDVTFFTGHMSGPNWSPGWLLDAEPPAPYARQLVSSGHVVESGYRNTYSDPEALSAQQLLLRTVVSALHEHPAIWLWNLGNEPDLFSLPVDDVAGPAWAELLTRTIRGIDPKHPVTTGLHVASLVDDNHLRIDRIFRSADLATMHAYPAYADWSIDPLDTDFVAFTCALTASLSGKRVLAEEFGACTAPPGEAAQYVDTVAQGRLARQFMAREEDFAAHLEEVLPRLVGIGALGAMVWCFADYHESLWDRPPCNQMVHERHFGLVRPDGSLKPHAQVLRRFAASAPVIIPPSDRARIEVDPDDFYFNPMRQLPELYQRFREGA